MAFDFSYPGTTAGERGWGRGWEPGLPIGSRPPSFPGEIVSLAVRGVSFPGGIRAELHDLVVLLVETSLDREYIPRLDDPGCWGGAFRPTKRADGSYTTTPSNHSWYTAVDINAPHNVYGSDQHQIPGAMGVFFRRYGWRWLGPPIKDWQHFDFAGTPADAREMTARAVRELGEDDMDPRVDEIIAAAQAFNRGEPEPKEGAGVPIYRALRRGANLPKPEPGTPGAVPRHRHEGGTTGDVVQG